MQATFNLQVLWALTTPESFINYVEKDNITNISSQWSSIKLLMVDTDSDMTKDANFHHCVINSKFYKYTMIVFGHLNLLPTGKLADD